MLRIAASFTRTASSLPAPVGRVGDPDHCGTVHPAAVRLGGSSQPLRSLEAVGPVECAIRRGIILKGSTQIIDSIYE